MLVRGSLSPEPAPGRHAGLQAPPIPIDAARQPAETGSPQSPDRVRFEEEPVGLLAEGGQRHRVQPSQRPDHPGNHADQNLRLKREKDRESDRKRDGER